MEFTNAHARYPEKKGFRLHRYTEEQFIFIHFLTPAEIVIGDKQTDIPTGACIFFPPHTDYVLTSERNDLVHDWFHAKGNVDELMAQYGLQFQTLYRPSGHEFITEAIAAIEAERSMKYPFFERICSLMGEELIAKIGRACTLPSVPTVAPELYRALCDVRERLHTDFAENWMVEQMAASVNLSPSYFHSLFTETVGMTPHDYLLDCRLGAAREMLCATSVPIDEIARQCGFGSQQYMANVFRKRLNVYTKRL